jgi:hypothetical protein
MAVAIALAASVGKPASASVLEVCCDTMGDCPEGYKCCVPGDSEPTCGVGEKEGYCRTSCTPIIK